MDHLEFLLGPTRQGTTFEVPYVSEDYDQGDFQTFGERKGYSCVNDLLKLRDEDLEAFGALVQTWLYFGLLWEIFGTLCETEDFIVSGPTRKLISTTLLPRYCAEWLSATSDRSGHELMRMDKSLDFATLLSDRLDEELEGNPLSNARLIVFSIKILIETLGIALELAIRRSGQPRALVRKPAVSKYLLDYFLDNGWCPARITNTSYQLQSKSLYLLTAFDPATLIGANHRNCGHNACNVDNLQDYSAQHVSDCSCNDCPLVHVPNERLLAICEAGEVPVLSCTLDCSGILNIDLIASSQRPTFIAISHVWSDGLGNDTANALYQCQIVDVARQVRHLRDLLDAEASSGSLVPSEPNELSSQSVLFDGQPVLFWLDTLCIPLDGKARKSAIGRIDRTFAAADAVLVRDSGLQRLSSPFEMLPLQLAIYMHCMKWLTRCWTLAEGVAAWKIHLQFSGRAYNLDELIKHLKVDKPMFSLRTPPCYYEVLNENLQEGTLEMENYSAERRQFEARLESPAYQTLELVLPGEIQLDLMKIFDTLGSAKKGVPHFSTTWNSLLHRSTTKIQDVPGILAIANAISIRDVVQLSQDLRLKAVINTFREIPASLLFNRGPKCDSEPKNRWVPSQVHGGSLMAEGPIVTTVTTNKEGRVLGPLDTSQFLTFKFQGTELKAFDLWSDTSQARPQFHVQMLDVNAQYLRNQVWCLVLPKEFVSDGFLATTSCTAFCATIQKMNPEGGPSEERSPAERHPEEMPSEEGAPEEELLEEFSAEEARWHKRTFNVLARWETLAKVTVLPHSLHTYAPVHGEALKCELFIECDMASWPLPTSLSSYFTPEQERKIKERIKWMKVFAGASIFLGLAIGIGLLTSGSGSGTKASERVRIGVAVALGFVLVVLFFALISIRVGPTLYEADLRTHEDWEQLFMNADIRADQSLRYRLLRLLRRWYSTQPLGASSTEAIELESQKSTQHPSALAFRRQFSKIVSKMFLGDILPFLRLLLCAIELGLIARINQALSGVGTQEITIALTFIPVGISLFAIPGTWVYNSIHPSKKRSIVADIVSIVLWLICMGLLLQITRSPPMRNYHGVGLGAVVLAGIQPLLVICSIVYRELGWLVEQWQKSPITYYDLFEVQPADSQMSPDKCFIFIVLIWNPLRNALDRLKSRY